MPSCRRGRDEEEGVRGEGGSGMRRGDEEGVRDEEGSGERRGQG